METIKVTFKMKKNVYDRFELLHKELGGTKKDLFHELIELGMIEKIKGGYGNEERLHRGRDKKIKG